MLSALKIIQEYRNRQRQLKQNAPYAIKFYNFWKQDVPDMWFYRFIQSRNLLKNRDRTICFYSTFGSRDIIGKTKGDLNVFFTGENLKRGGHRLYADHFLNDRNINIALGFEYFDDPRYLRFPLWMLYMFDPESNDDDIIKRCEEINHPLQKNTHSKFACHISSEDILGLRTEICELLSQIESVDCAGKVMHNTDELWRVYGDDKMKYISNYKFNICPENSNCLGYVTEKVFEAIDAGCIPIYWGSYNSPEPSVLNTDAILFWEKESDNSDTVEFIRQLNNSPALYGDFTQQPRLKQDAAKYVIEKFHDLENEIRALL